MKTWIDRGLYWEHTASQGTDEWKKARIGRVTSSNNSYLIRHSMFSNPEETGKRIAGVIPPISHNEAMDHGHLYEPIARKYYMNKYNCKVIERNLCIPKDPAQMWIGASVDGDVIDTDGIIEIKCPKKMYPKLVTYMEHKENGFIHNNLNHIFDSHIEQMMQGMFVLKKKWCDYVVYCSDTDNFIQRIYFNQNYWYNDLYPSLYKNYQKHVLPYLYKK